MNHPESGRDELLHALNDCHSRLARGESLEQCVDSHPDDLRDELRAMLAVASRVSSSAVDPEPAFVEQLEADLRARQLANRPPPETGPRGIPWWGFTFRRLAIGFAACLVLVVGTGFVAAEASSDALPGEPLYRVKQFRERVELWLARSDSAEFRTYRTLIDRRTAEVERATSEGQAERIADRLRDGLAASIRKTVDHAIRLNSAGHPEAVERAMTSLGEAQRRLRLLAEATRDPQQLRLLSRIGRFIEQEVERLQSETGTFRERGSAGFRQGSDHRSAASVTISPTEGASCDLSALRLVQHRPAEAPHLARLSDLRVPRVPAHLQRADEGIVQPPAVSD